MNDSGWRIDGRWEGEYSYFPTEVARIVLPKVRFVLMAEADSNGAFWGIIEDDPRLGNPKPAQVTGRWHGNQVSFTKQYPELCYCDGKRSMSVADYLAAEFGINIQQEFAAPPIQYEGRYDETEQIVTGTWKFPSVQIRFDHQDQRLGLEYPAGNGSWLMRREYYIV